MEIEVISSGKTTFGDLKIGEPFRYGDHRYIKLDRSQAIVVATHLQVTAFSYPNTEVTRAKNVKIVFED